jgi:hypothetical protein
MRFSYIVLTWVICAITVACDEVASQSETPPKVTSTNSVNGPLKVGLDNPWHFVDSLGNSIYLTGSHTHLNMLDREGEEAAALNFDTYLRFLQDRAHNFTKLWAWEDNRHTPLPYQRVGPGTALDGKPTFNLAQFNEEFFDRLRSRVEAARNHNIYVVIMLFNGWSVESKEPNRHIWPRHPFHRDNNVSGIDGDPNGVGEGAEVQTLSNPAITAIQEVYVRKVIDSVNDLDNVMYEISNESAATVENTVWQYHMIDYIHGYERTKPKQHPVGMTVQWPNGSNQVLYESPADWISPNPNEGHNINPPASNHGKVVLNDTDHLWGNGGNVDWVWKSFTRGLNPIFMDLTPPLSERYTLPQAEDIRVAMGDTLEYAQRVDLEEMAPRQELCSTTFCLVNPGREYLLYVPPTPLCSVPLTGRPVGCELTVDLSYGEKTFEVEWFNPETRKTISADTIVGGAVRTFISPFRGSSVLYLKARES